MKTFNVKIVVLIIGALLLVESVFIAIAGGVAYAYQGDDASSFFHSFLITIGVSAVSLYLGRKAEKRLGNREGYLIVSLVWVIFSAFGALPFYISGAIPSYTDAYFETMSGFTTTGSSILTSIETMPHGVLFWRSLTQWLGGMGIIVFSLAVLPLFGIGGGQLYTAEATGPTYAKIRPRIKDTSKMLWTIYLVLTMAEFVLLMVFGMGWFDAICHAFTTMATGGYSTKNASIAAFASPAIEYVIIVFMFLAGINFSLLYYLFYGKFHKFIKDEEMKWYTSAVLIFSGIVALTLMWQNYEAGQALAVEHSVRTALFQIISLITTTGYATADYMTWLPIALLLCLFIMLPGGSAGSTAGGMKWVRVIIFIKNGYYEFKRLIHPNAVIPIRLNKSAIPAKVVNNISAFIVIYVGVILVSIFLFCAMGIGISESVGATFTSISNVGPGLGASGPVGNFAHFPCLGKWLMSFLMLIGRLEMFTVLSLFLPMFWRK